MGKRDLFTQAKREIVENLETLQATLTECTSSGMQDPGARFHNELVDLIADAKEVGDPTTLEEIIAQAKTLETDIAAWLSFHGQATVSLSWPVLSKRPRY